MLKIQSDPTFTVPVTIPTPQGQVQIKVEYKHRDTDEFDEFIKKEAELNRSNKETLMDVIVNWYLVDGEFNAANLEKLCKQYHQAAAALMATYINEQTQAKAKNSER